MIYIHLIRKWSVAEEHAGVPVILDPSETSADEQSWGLLPISALIVLSDSE